MRGKKQITVTTELAKHTLVIFFPTAVFLSFSYVPSFKCPQPFKSDSERLISMIELHWPAGRLLATKILESGKKKKKNYPIFFRALSYISHVLFSLVDRISYIKLIEN